MSHTSSNKIHPLNPENPTMTDDYLYAASCQDCTGLIPSIAHSEIEAANYDELFHYLPPIPPSSITGVPDDPFLAAEGIHAEVNTLDGNHIL